MRSRCLPACRARLDVIAIGVMVAVGVAVGIDWCGTRPATARPRPRAAPVGPRPARAQPDRKGAARDCAAWPPREFPRISDIYALKLEYDCRNRALAHRRYGLASQEARQSARLAELRDRNGLAEKNRWAEKEQSDIESRQLQLDEWRDEVLRGLRPATPEPSEPAPMGPPDPLGASRQNVSLEERTAEPGDAAAPAAEAEASGPTK